MRFKSTCLFSLLVFVSSLGASRSARAQTAVECAERFEQGQIAHSQLKFSAAKRDFVACSQLSCPQPIVKDCVEALETVERELPAFGLRVRDAEGQELLNVTVMLDGAPLTDHLDGSMYQRDPGVHRLRIEASEFKPLEIELSLLPGERTRVVEVELEPTKPRLPPPPAAVETPPLAVPRPQPSFRVPLPSVIAAGAGAVALGGFIYFRVRASNGYDSLGECRPYCSTDRVDEVRSRYVLSSVALGISGVALATAGVTLWLFQPKTEAQGLAFEIKPLAAGLRGKF
jgi:hypothetical protein